MASGTLTDALLPAEVPLPVPPKVAAAFTSSRVCRVALDVALVTAVGLLILYVNAAAWGQDLGVYRSGGRAVLQGHSLYRPSFVSVNGLLFTYPPFAAMVFAPLFAIAQHTAMALWTLATLVCAGVLVVLSINVGFKVTVPRRWRPHLILVGGLAAAAFAPIEDCLSTGQIGVFLTLLCLADAALPRTRWRRGVLVGLATAMKMTPGLFIVYFALTGQWRALRTSVMTVAICWVTAAVFLPNDSADFFLRGKGFEASRVGDVRDHLNESLNGLWHRVPVDRPTVWWFGSAVLVFALGMWRARRAFQAGDVLAGAVLVGFVMLLISPVSWLHHAAWVVPAVVVLARNPKWRYRASAVGLVAMLCIPVTHIEGARYSHGIAVEAYVALYLVIIALLPILSPIPSQARLRQVGAK